MKKQIYVRGESHLPGMMEANRAVEQRSAMAAFNCSSSWDLYINYKRVVYQDAQINQKEEIEETLQ